MLKKISHHISPELIKVLMEMGHGDELALVDGNFPATSHATRCIPSLGSNTTDLLTAILDLFPLDEYVEAPIALMMHGPEVARPEVWNQYERIIKDASSDFNVEFLNRFEFYERARKVYAIVATSDKQLYANIILKKGVIA